MLIYAQVFKKATLSFSKAEASIAKVLPAMDKINEVLTSNAVETNYLPSIKAALAIGSRLLNQYYALTDMSDVYRIATSKPLDYFSSFAANISRSSSPFIQTTVPH